MQKIEWSKDDLLREFEGSSNIIEIIEQIEGRLGNKGRYVCQVAVDDTPIGDDIDKVSGRSLWEIGHLTFETQSLQELVCNSCRSVIDIVPRLLELVDAMALDFEEEDRSAGAQQFVKFLDSYRWLYETLLHLKDLFSNTDNHRWSLDDLDLNQSGPVSNLRKLLNAFETEDNILLAEVLRYEIVPSLRSWKNSIERCYLTVKGLDTKNERTEYFSKGWERPEKAI